MIDQELVERMRVAKETHTTRITFIKRFDVSILADKISTGSEKPKVEIKKLLWDPSLVELHNCLLNSLLQ